MMGSQIRSYTLLKKLGSGMSGTVYEALGKSGRVAVKVAHPTVAELATEAQALAALCLPQVAQVLEVGRTDDGTAYLVMELVEGESLYQRMEERWISHKGRCTLEETLQIGKELAEALYKIHNRGIVHRDLKPENILLVPSSNGEREQVKILDFGVAYIDRGTEQYKGANEVGLVIGTPSYMSPEQCAGKQVVSGKADVYSLGVILYEMLTGHLPFSSPNTEELLLQHLFAEPLSIDAWVKTLPKEIVRLVHAMLSKDERLRPTMAEVAGILGKIQAGVQVRVGRTSSPTEWVRSLFAPIVTVPAPYRV